MGFEPTRAEHNGLAVHRLNHSATSSDTLGMIHEGILLLGLTLEEWKGSVHPSKQCSKHLGIQFSTLNIQLTTVEDKLTIKSLN